MSESFSAGMLPGILPSPTVRVGLTTQHVLFLTDGLIEKLLSGKAVWEGKMRIQKWKAGEDLTLPTEAEAIGCKHSHCPLRIVIIQEGEVFKKKDFLPLQQCVDTRFEKRRKIGSGS